MQQKRTFLALAAAAARRAMKRRMGLHDGVAGCHGVLGWESLRVPSGLCATTARGWLPCSRVVLGKGLLVLPLVAAVKRQSNKTTE